MIEQVKHIIGMSADWAGRELTFSQPNSQWTNQPFKQKKKKQIKFIIVSWVPI